MNAEPVASEPRPLYWSVRREIWENRSVWLAPLIVAAVVLFATSVTILTLPMRLHAASTPAKVQSAIVKPFGVVPAPIMFTTIMVGFIYCLDALYGERRDRSILFWKSLPVSDRTTVLAKALIPLVVLPLIALVLSVIARLILLPISAIALAASGRSLELLRGLQFFSGLLIMIYGMTVHALWYAPIYGWLMLVSAWARRTPVIWALMPPLLISAVERIVSGSRWSFMYMLQYRVMGAMREAFIWDRKGRQIDGLDALTPGRFLSAPGLWVGLVFAVACFAIAVRLRRNREPI